MNIRWNLSPAKTIVITRLQTPIPPHYIRNTWIWRAICQMFISLAVWVITSIITWTRLCPVQSHCLIRCNFAPQFNFPTFIRPQVVFCRRNTYGYDFVCGGRVGVPPVKDHGVIVPLPQASVPIGAAFAIFRCFFIGYNLIKPMVPQHQVQYIAHICIMLFCLLKVVLVLLVLPFSLFHKFVPFAFNGVDRVIKAFMVCLFS